MKFRFKRRRIFTFEFGRQIPVFFGLEIFYFVLPVADHPDGDGLNAPRAQASFDLVPQHRTYLITDQTVQNAAGLLRFIFVEIQLQGIFDGLGHGIFG